MAVTKWCVLNASNQVVDVILWDNVAQPLWQPPLGSTVVPYDATLPIAPLPVTVVNERTVRNALTNAMQTNRDYRAITAPTNAQVVAQMDFVTRQLIGIERLLLGQLDAAT